MPKDPNILQLIPAPKNYYVVDEKSTCAMEKFYPVVSIALAELYDASGRTYKSVVPIEEELGTTYYDLVPSPTTRIVDPRDIADEKRACYKKNGCDNCTFPRNYEL